MLTGLIDAGLLALTEYYIFKEPQTLGKYIFQGVFFGFACELGFPYLYGKLK